MCCWRDWQGWRWEALRLRFEEGWVRQGKGSTRAKERDASPKFDKRSLARFIYGLSCTVFRFSSPSVTQKSSRLEMIREIFSSGSQGADNVKNDKFGFWTIVRKCHERMQHRSMRSS
nr:hypothetical protein CFP56_28513 [Quercus suber]